MAPLCLVFHELAVEADGAATPAARRAWTLGKELREAGWAVTVLHTGEASEAERAFLTSGAEEAGLSYRNLNQVAPLDRKVFPAVASHRLALRVMRALEAIGPEAAVVVGHAAHSSAVVAARRCASALANCRLVLVVDEVAEHAREVEQVFPADGRESIATDFLEREAIGGADGVVCTSEALRRWLALAKWRASGIAAFSGDAEGLGRKVAESLSASSTAAANAPLPKVSVCVAHYEHPRFLGQALASLEAQTMPAHEVIVIDDGSASAEARAAFAQAEAQYGPRGWKFLREANAGPSAARNRAARDAAGEAIIFCDADNWFYPDMVATFSRALAASGADCVTCSFAVVPDPSESAAAGSEYVFAPLGPCLELGAVENVLGDTNFIIRREVFEAMGGFQTAKRGPSEDWEFLLRLVLDGRSLAGIPAVLFEYRLTAGSHGRRLNEVANAQAAVGPVFERLAPVWRRLWPHVAGMVRDPRVGRLEDALAAAGARHAEEALAWLQRDRVRRASLFLLENSQQALDASLRVSREQAAEQGRRDAGVIAEFSRQVAELNRRIAELERAREQNADKIRRMQESFSWALTAPLRSLRRILLDRRRKEAVPPAAAEPPAGVPVPVPVAPEPGSYGHWVRTYDTPAAEQLQALRAAAEAMPAPPKISVLMAVFNPERERLSRAVSSVRAQSYPHWELCIADDASTQPHVREILERISREEPRIRVVFRERNGGACAATNSALEIAGGEWAAVFDTDGELAPQALSCIAGEIIAHPQAELIYSDEDGIDGQGERFSPHFKPGWNPDLLLGQNYISHLAVYRTATLRALGGMRAGFDGSQDWDLALRVTERANAAAIRHVPRVLYHGRKGDGVAVRHPDWESGAAESARRALAEHLARTECPALILPTVGGHWRISRPLPLPRPLVSIILPARDPTTLLKVCFASILVRTDYAPYEILLVNSRPGGPKGLGLFGEYARDYGVRVLDREPPFNQSASSNFAARQSRGEILCFLSGEIEVLGTGWLGELVSHAVRPEIGAVGARLYTPGMRLQHAGVMTGIGGVAGHAFRNFQRDDPGTPQFRPHLAQNLSAVTAACLAIRRAVFFEVGGFDEQGFSPPFNEVDFCLKVQALGYRNLYTPFAELIHHEPAGRGPEDSPEKARLFREETAAIQERWGAQLSRDPAYNPNLSLDSEDFALAYPPRVPPLV